MSLATTLTQSGLPSITIFTFNWNFTSSTITFFFFAALSSWLAKSLFQVLIYVKCHMGLPMGDKGLQNLTHFLSWIIGTLGKISNRLWEKWHDGSLIIICICCLYSNLWTEELVVKSVYYAQLIYCGNWNSNCCWETGVV